MIQFILWFLIGAVPWALFIFILEKEDVKISSILQIILAGFCGGLTALILFVAIIANPKDYKWDLVLYKNPWRK